MAKWTAIGTAPARRWLRRRVHCGRLPSPRCRRHAHRLVDWRVAAALHSTWARAAGHRRVHPDEVRKVAPSPLACFAAPIFASSAAAHSPWVMARLLACLSTSPSYGLRCSTAVSGAAVRGSSWHQSRVPVHDVCRLERPSEADPIIVSYNEPSLRISGPDGTNPEDPHSPPPGVRPT